MLVAVYKHSKCDVLLSYSAEALMQNAFCVPESIWCTTPKEIMWWQDPDIQNHYVALMRRPDPDIQSWRSVKRLAATTPSG
jgi:hypothetical protein